MCAPNLKSVAAAIEETWTKFQNLKVGQGDVDYNPFDLLPYRLFSTPYSLSTC